jgi:hypothetical protein
MLKLTDDTTDQAGCAWYNGSAVYACQLKVGFTMKISGTASNAADGIAFVLQPSPLVNAACGGVGGDVGVGGIPGVSVRFQHLKGVFTNVGFWENATNTQRCTGTSVPVFQVDHAYAVEVNVLAGRVIVNIDGTKYLDCDASQWLPTGNLIYGFTAATGAQQAAHFIDDLVATGALLLGGTGFGAQCSAP